MENEKIRHLKHTRETITLCGRNWSHVIFWTIYGFHYGYLDFFNFNNSVTCESCLQEFKRRMIMQELGSEC